MNDAHLLLEVLDKMKYNPIRNYILPGLTSSMLGVGEQGCVRMFDSTRETEHFIHPHTHRFDFACVVLEGKVVNTIYDTVETKRGHYDSNDEFSRSEIKGKLGEYECTYIARGETFYRRATTYTAGDIYSMMHDEFHSVAFFEGAKVLFFQGPDLRGATFVLEPHTKEYGTIPTFRTEHWMFKDVR